MAKVGCWWLVVFLTRSLFPPPVSLQPCLSAGNVSCTLWEWVCVCRHNLAYSFISLFLTASPPSVSSTLCDSPSACTSTSPLPLILSMVTPLTPISVKYTRKAHTYSELSITCMSACLNNGLCVEGYLIDKLLLLGKVLTLKCWLSIRSNICFELLPNQEEFHT